MHTIIFIILFLSCLSCAAKLISPREAKYNEKSNIMFMDSSEIIYPRANETFRRIHKEHWLKYYECLKERYVDIGPEKMLYPVAFTTLEGTSVRFECQICLSPAEDYIPDVIEWLFNSSNDRSTFNRTIEPTEHIVISSNGKYLTMYNVQSNQAGKYWCKLEATIQAPYYLYVDIGDEPISVVHPETAPSGPYPALPKVIPEYNLKIYTMWANWSPCSTCDAVGKRVRYGYCTMSMISDTGHTYVVNESTTTDQEQPRHHKREVTEDEEGEVVSTTQETIEIDKELMTSLRTVLMVFKNTLPCISTYIPKEIRDLTIVKDRQTEMMVQYCKTKCARDIVFEVRDKNGNILESANNSAGIYSMLQGLPDTPPAVIRVILYRRHNKEARLVCPGNLNTDTPIVWKIGKIVLIPTDIKEQSSGRIYVTPQMHIVFTKLHFSDADIYSCWQNNELAGTITLNVTGETELKVNQHIVMIGGIIIVVVFLIVFWRAFQGRKRFTMH